MSKAYCVECQEYCEGGSWPKCPKGHSAVHLGRCAYCDNVIGYVIDDDYCGPDILMCPNHLKQ